MRVQLDRFEDNDLAVLLLYPHGKRCFDMPRELLPEDAEPGDIFTLSFEHDREETDLLKRENSRLLDELLRRDEK